MRLVGRAEQRSIDQLWQKMTGLPLLLLMESAATAVVRVCRQLLESLGCPAGRILILAGKGQNGGDAFACARLLGAEGFAVTCREVFSGAEQPPEAALNRQALLLSGAELGSPQDSDFAILDKNCLIIDGIYGTGYQADRPLPPPAAVAARQIAAARGRGVRVVAIDIPSGVDADSGAVAKWAVQADCTVTFVRLKTGLSAAPGRFQAGHIIVDAIGVSDAIADEAAAQVDRQKIRPPCYQINAADVQACRPSRPSDSHKGMFGKVLLLGGAAGMPGAILLAAEAAARSGAGLVYLSVPETIAPLVLSARPDCLLNTFPENPYNPVVYRTLTEKLIADQPAVAAGPGAGAAGWLAELLPLLIRQVRHLVLDADALNQMAANLDSSIRLLQERTDILGLPPAILTPHPGEFRRLAPDIDLQDRQMAASALAERSRCIVVLKGASTVVAVPGSDIWINPTGHDGLARGGSGDVLCGLIAGLLGQGLTPEKAAISGVYLHGFAAELAAGHTGRRAMLPTDVIACLGDVFRQCGWEDEPKTNENQSRRI